VPHDDPARITRQALRRVDRNARAALEHGLARSIGIRQHLRVDVDHHLVALARGAGIDAVMQRRLREEAERVRLLLRHGRRFRGNVHDARLGCTPKVRHRN